MKHWPWDESTQHILTVWAVTQQVASSKQKVGRKGSGWEPGAHPPSRCSGAWWGAQLIPPWALVEFKTV